MKQELLNKLNQNVADLQILYVKLHNYHWHVKGRMFLPVHQMTEAYYNYVSKQYDAVAERLLQLGQRPGARMVDYLEAGQIKEVQAKDFTVEEVLTGVKKDFTYLLEEYRQILSLAESAGDMTTADMATQNIAWLEKELWMLESTLF